MIKLHRTDGPPHGYLTVGYWYFEKPNNKGTLHVEVANLPDWRFSLAVIGHEFIEVFYCWLFGITTERADKFDDWMEGEYESGRIPKDFEGGFHKDCPYRLGHLAGYVFEVICITLTLASWKKYGDACNRVMGL